VLSIVVSLLVVLVAFAILLGLVIPPFIEEFDKFLDLVSVFMQGSLADKGMLGNALRYADKYINEEAILDVMKQDSFVATIKSIAEEAWGFIYRTIDFMMGLTTVVIVLLYLFFILLDYEKISKGFLRMIPSENRAFATNVFNDVKRGMNAYFRGQSFIAFCVGILFSIGFLIIDFPMAIGLGLFIGVLNLVPYLQLVGFIPTVVLAMLKAADTGENFWVIMALALVVFGVVQAIQDLYLTPRIMGKEMGLNPAVILLSLSIWGSLLGFIGLIIALPLTTLIISYYSRYVLEENETHPEHEKTQPDKKK
ncbi:MAG: AI-2E family transporter, partial [Bacteroidaceae bacterium]|nr:AI-2E family transporter [Bacteroidaceae bacterium]